MNIKHLLLITTTLLCSTNAYSMDPTSLYELRRTGQQNITPTNDQDRFLSIPEDIWLYTIAHYQIKDDIRKACKYFHKLASSTNTALLTHPSLVLSNKALEQFLLYHAAMGDTAIVRHLLALGADPNACDDKQMTAMHYAAQYGHVEIVDMLLQHPALIKTDIANGETSPLLLAIKHDHSMVVKTIFLACKLHSEDTLFNATYYGALNSVRILLACDIDINSQSSHGYCPLMAATVQRHAHLVKFLITNGAEVNCRCKGKNDLNMTSLHLAANRGSTDITQLLINYGADVNLKGILNATPLHCASSKEHIHIVTILLNNGAHVNEKDNNGYTPLDVARNDEIKQLLIAYGGKTGTELNPIKIQNEPEKENNNCVVQ